MPICLVTQQRPHFKLFNTCLCAGLLTGDSNDVIHDAEGACEGHYGFTSAGHYVWNHKQYQPE